MYQVAGQTVVVLPWFFGGWVAQVEGVAVAFGKTKFEALDNVPSY